MFDWQAPSHSSVPLMYNYRQRVATTTPCLPLSSLPTRMYLVVTIKYGPAGDSGDDYAGWQHRMLIELARPIRWSVWM